MPTSRYFAYIAVLTVLAAVLPAILYFAMGARWFSFYGWAATILAGLPVLMAILLKRYAAIGRRRWPIIVLGLVIALAAIVQIVFWAAFFGLGPDGILLGAGRSMILPYIETALPIAAAGAAIAVVWAVWRGKGAQD